MLTSMWIFMVLLLVGLIIVIILDRRRSYYADPISVKETIYQQIEEHQSHIGNDLGQIDSERVYSKASAGSNIMSNQGWRLDRKIQDCQSMALKQTFPNIDYSLYGYNILKGYPLHDGKDPGFTRPIFMHNFTDNRFTADCRYSIPRGVTVAPDVSCVTSFTSSIVQNSYDFQKSLSVNAKAHAGGWGVSFSASGGYQETVSIISSGQQKVILSTAHCNQYFTKFNWFEPPEFSPEMKEWLATAEEEFKKNQRTSDNSIYRLFEYFGTHLPVETLYGARYTYEHRVDTSKLDVSIAQKLSVELELSGSGFGFSGGLGFGLSSEEKAAAKQFRENVETRTISVGAPPPYNGDAMTWASTVQENPVPVSTTLEPIYSIFDRNYVKQTMISEEFAEHLHTRMQKLSVEYCKHAQSLGIKVECEDKSVLKFPKLRGWHSPRETVSVENENSCLEECHKLLGCVMVDWMVKGSEQNCRLYKYATNHPADITTPYLEVNNCTSPTTCTMYVIQTRIVEAPLRLRGLSYKSGQRNKLKLQGSPGLDYVKEYELFSRICGYMCSKDALCIAFQVAAGQKAVDSDYNCATISEHLTNNLRFEQGKSGRQSDFDIQLLSKKAKQDLVENINNMEFTMPCGSFVEENAVPNTVNDNEDGCQQTCKENKDCTNFSFLKSSTTCTAGSSQGTYTYKTKTCSANDDTFKVLPYKDLRGWMNISNLEVTNHCGESRAAVTRQEDCARECLSNVSCHFASFYNGICKQMKPSTSQADIDTGCFSFRSRATLFLPNYDAKLEYFQSVEQ